MGFNSAFKGLIATVNPRTPCRQLFKRMNILTIVSLYILEVISYLRRHHQFVELNSNVHAYNARRRRDIHIQSYKTDLYRVRQKYLTILQHSCEWNRWHGEFIF
jgi:hypothetical protein